MSVTAARTASIALVLALTACSQSAPPPAAEPKANVANESAPAPATPSGQELNQAIHDPIDRAKAVEGQLMQHQEQQEKDIDAQGH